MAPNERGLSLNGGGLLLRACSCFGVCLALSARQKRDVDLRASRFCKSLAGGLCTQED